MFRITFKQQGKSFGHWHFTAFGAVAVTAVAVAVTAITAGIWCLATTSTNSSIGHGLTVGGFSAVTCTTFTGITLRFVLTGI